MQGNSLKNKNYYFSQTCWIWNYYSQLCTLCLVGYLSPNIRHSLNKYLLISIPTMDCWWSAVRQMQTCSLMSLNFVEFFSKFCWILCVSPFLFVPYAMPNLTTENPEKSLDDKLCPLSEQFKQGLESIFLLNKNIKNIQETLTKLEKDKMVLLEENASLEAQSSSTANDLKQVKKSLNDSEQYIRR